VIGAAWRGIGGAGGTRSLRSDPPAAASWAREGGKRGCSWDPSSRARRWGLALRQRRMLLGGGHCGSGTNGVPPAGKTRWRAAAASPGAGRLGITGPTPCEELTGGAGRGWFPPKFRNGKWELPGFWGKRRLGQGEEGGEEFPSPSVSEGKKKIPYFSPSSSSPHTARKPQPSLPAEPGPSRRLPAPRDSRPGARQATGHRRRGASQPSRVRCPGGPEATHPAQGTPHHVPAEAKPRSGHRQHRFPQRRRRRGVRRPERSQERSGEAFQKALTPRLRGEADAQPDSQGDRRPLPARHASPCQPRSSSPPAPGPLSFPSPRSKDPADPPSRRSTPSVWPSHCRVPPRARRVLCEHHLQPRRGGGRTRLRLGAGEANPDFPDFILREVPGAHQNTQNLLYPGKAAAGWQPDPSVAKFTHEMSLNLRVRLAQARGFRLLPG